MTLAVLTCEPADPYLGVVTGFQPAGRAPAPAPLDLLQDFVNTEIPEWAQDDLGVAGGALGLARRAWAARAGAEPDPPTRSCAPGPCGRACARSPSPTRPAAPGAAGVAASLAELGPLRFVLAVGDDGAPAFAPAGRRRRPGARRARRDRRRRSAGGHVVAVQGVPQGQLRLDLLRPFAQPVVELVLDDDLRQPDEDGGLPAPARRPREGCPLRRRARLRHGCGVGRRGRSSQPSGSRSGQPC